MSKVIVFHQDYGCDTGCCGHVVALEGAGEEDDEVFRFGHPWGQDHLEYAMELIEETFGEEHVKDLDWANSRIVED